MAHPDEHLQALLELPIEARAHAAELLLDSLDDEVDDPDEQAMRAAELTRRARSVVDGSAKLVDAGEVERRISARLRDLRR